MLKKRLIFTLLYDSGYFSLSRNFRLQRVGNLKWLKENYNFEYISRYIDELIVLDVSKEKRDIKKFSNTLKELTEKIFVPIASGGGIRKFEHAKILLDSGADKVIMNTSIFKDNDLISKLSSEFGRQCIVGSLDIKKEKDGYHFYISNGKECVKKSIDQIDNILKQCPLGEIILHSIDRDGTGQGYDLDSLSLINKEINIPIIISGGAGNSKHFIEGLSHDMVDAASSSHLFNFVGDGLKKAREKAIENNVLLAKW